MMLNKLYSVLRKLITRKEEQNQYSGGLWPRLAREAAAAGCVGRTGNLIELGCGEGLFLEMLARGNPAATVYGVDFRESIIEVAKSRLLQKFNNVRLFAGNALTTQLGNRQFDCTFCMNTVYNLNSAHEVSSLFGEAHRITRPGGLFVFDIRNSYSPIIQLQYRLVRFYDTAIKVPLTSYTARHIGSLLEENGFQVTDTRHIGFPGKPFAPVILFTARATPNGVPEA